MLLALRSLTIKGIQEKCLQIATLIVEKKEIGTSKLLFNCNKSLHERPLGGTLLQLQNVIPHNPEQFKDIFKLSDRGGLRIVVSRMLNLW